MNTPKPSHYITHILSSHKSSHYLFLSHLLNSSKIKNPQFTNSVLPNWYRHKHWHVFDKIIDISALFFSTSLDLGKYCLLLLVSFFCQYQRNFSGPSAMMWYKVNGLHSKKQSLPVPVAVWLCLETWKKT